MRSLWQLIEAIINLYIAYSNSISFEVSTVNVALNPRKTLLPSLKKTIIISLDLDVTLRGKVNPEADNSRSEEVDEPSWTSTKSIIGCV